MNGLQTMWASRSRREQIMLIGLVGLIVLVGGWYGVLQPLNRWQAETAFEHQSAEMRSWLMSRQIEQARAYNLQGQSARVVLEQVARQSDLQVRLSSLGDGLRFELDRVPSSKARDFLVQMEQQKLSPESLRIDVHSDGTLQIIGQIVVPAG